MKCSNTNYELFYLNLIDKRVNLTDTRVAFALLIDKPGFPTSLSIISERAKIGSSSASRSLKTLVEKGVFVRVRHDSIVGTIYNIHSDMLKPRELPAKEEDGYRFLDSNLVSEE